MAQQFETKKAEFEKNIGKIRIELIRAITDMHNYIQTNDVTFNELTELTKIVDNANLSDFMKKEGL